MSSRVLKTSLLAAGAALFLLGGTAQAQQKITYLLPAPPTLPAFAPWVLAQHLGYYKDVGYEMDFQVGRGGVDVAKQVGVGNAVLGGGIGDTPIVVRGNDIPVKTVGLIGGGSLTVVVGRKDRGIAKMEDLKGKTITALAFQDTTYYALLGALAKVGLKKSDVNAQAVGPAGVPNLVISGNADACACTPDWEVMVKDALGEGVVSMPTSTHFQSMAQAIIASDQMIKERPELVRAIVQATLKGMKFIMDDPAKAATAYVAAVPAMQGKEAFMTRVLANYTERAYKGQAVLGEVDPKRLDAVQQFYVAEGVIRKAAPLDELYTNQFVK